MGESPASSVNGFPGNAISVGDGIVLINVFSLDPDQAETFSHPGG